MSAQSYQNECELCWRGMGDSQSTRRGSISERLNSLFPIRQFQVCGASGATSRVANLLVAKDIVSHNVGPFENSECYSCFCGVLLTCCISLGDFAFLQSQILIKSAIVVSREKPR